MTEFFSILNEVLYTILLVGINLLIWGGIVLISNIFLDRKGYDNRNI